MTTLTIPSSVATIGAFAFFMNHQLANVTIPFADLYTADERWAGTDIWRYGIPADVTWHFAPSAP